MPSNHWHAEQIQLTRGDGRSSPVARRLRCPCANSSSPTISRLDMGNLLHIALDAACAGAAPQLSC